MKMKESNELFYELLKIILILLQFLFHFLFHNTRAKTNLFLQFLRIYSRYILLKINDKFFFILWFKSIT